MLAKLIIILFFFSGVSVAAPHNSIELIQLKAPNCFLKNLQNNQTILAKNSTHAIIEIPASQLSLLWQKPKVASCGNFFNISHLFTSTNTLKSKKLLAATLLINKSSFIGFNKRKISRRANYSIKHASEVNNVVSQILNSKIYDTLLHLTSYINRSSRNQSGYNAAIWLKKQFKHMAINANRTDIKTFLISTPNYLQPSIVGIIGKELKTPAIIIGAHMDTLEGKMPGAGDNASGSACVLEIARILLEANLKFTHPIYIIWYAAEEQGLVGSQQVVEYFIEHKIPVEAVLQFDMTGYRHQDDPTIWVYTDHTDSILNEFIGKLIGYYVHVPIGYSQCGYACSDHASWHEEEFPTVFPSETNFENHNPYIHTAADTLNLLNHEHLLNFTKLGLAFIVELAI